MEIVINKDNKFKGAVMSILIATDRKAIIDKQTKWIIEDKEWIVMQDIEWIEEEVKKYEHNIERVEDSVVESDIEHEEETIVKSGVDRQLLVIE